MNPDSYGYILVASLAGGFAGMLVMWNRSRSHSEGDNWLRRVMVLTAGTAAFACALIAFGKAFGGQSPLYAAVVMVLVTGWVALLHSAVSLPIPAPVLRVGAGEFRLLRIPGMGVRLFGAFLRHTPLRHLGGRVYLADVGRNPRVVLQGIHAAETVHLWALLFCSPWLVFWIAQGWWASLVCGLLVHVPLNVYPVLHLRYVTGRLERCAARTRRRARARPG
jgi:hypothetical protein